MKASLKVFIENGEIVIEANREGMQVLSGIASRLASLNDSEVQTPANHFHFMEGMDNAESGSMPLILIRKDS